jgi:excisionase family DNA binding protein
MTTSQAAKHFGVSQKTIQRWIAAGKLKADRIDGRWLIHLDVPDKEQEVLNTRHHNPNTGHDRESLAREYTEITHLRGQLNRRDEQIKTFSQQMAKLTQQIDHLTQVIAMSQKNIGVLAEQLNNSSQVIENMQNWSWWKRLFDATGDNVKPR